MDKGDDALSGADASRVVNHRDGPTLQTTWLSQHTDLIGCSHSAKVTSCNPDGVANSSMLSEF